MSRNSIYGFLVSLFAYSCDSLLKRNEIDPFLKRLIIGDQNWIVYNNVNQKKIVGDAR